MSITRTNNTSHNNNNTKMTHMGLQIDVHKNIDEHSHTVTKERKDNTPTKERVWVSV